MIVKLLTEHHLQFLSLKGGCRGSSESTLVKMSKCWKSHAAAQIIYIYIYFIFEMILTSYKSLVLPFKRRVCFVYCRCNNFSLMLGRSLFVEPVCTVVKIKSLSQRHNTVPMMRLEPETREPETPRSKVEHYTTEKEGLSGS